MEEIRVEMKHPI